MTRRLIVAVMVCVAALWSLADGSIVVTSVTAQQRYPWNGLVDIVVTIQGDAEQVAKTECTFAATNSATQAAVSICSVKKVVVDSVSGNICTRRYLWDADADVGSVRIDDIALTVDAKIHSGVQLWENGPYWAECNVGATQPEEYGYYFWWGDTVGYKRNKNNDGWVSVENGATFQFYGNNFPTYGKDNPILRSWGYIDATGNLAAAHDAATAHLGSPWRMPTDAEFLALINNCTTTWTTRNGVFGQLVMGKGAYSSKSIFLPAAGKGNWTYLLSAGSYGHYRSSTPNSDDYCAWTLCFYSGYFDRIDSDRYCGKSVRSLRGFGTTAVTVAGVITHLKLDCRTGVRDVASEGEDLHYDLAWYESGEAIRVVDNGVALTNGTVGSYLWHPAPCSTVQHLLKLEVLCKEEITKTETAEFNLDTPTVDHAAVITQPAVEATCCAAGMTAEIRCSRCNELLQAAEIPALGYVRNVTARQLWPHKKVEVCYELAEDIGEVAGEDAKATVKCLSGGKTYTAVTLLGDCGCAPGQHCVVWDMEVDGIRVNRDDVKFTVEF